MNYIYDVLVNFNENLYSFYDWNINDNIDHIRKIPFFKVDNKTFKDIEQNKVTFSKEFLEKINKKTELFTNKGVRIVSFAFIISNGLDALALSIGNNLKKSKLLIDEEIDVLEMCERIDITKIDYKIVKVSKKNNFKTRKEIEIEKYINRQLKDLYKENNIEKLSYIYYECFNLKERTSEKIIDKINYEIKYNFDNISPKLYKFFKLLQFNK